MLLGVKKTASKLFGRKDKANAPRPLGHDQVAMKTVKVLVAQCLTF